MSDTPLTDAIVIRGTAETFLSLARKLERKLAAMTAERDKLRNRAFGALTCATSKQLKVTDMERLDMVVALLGAAPENAE
jgi:hypothetical protein